ncbi:MAG: hypothetical protein ACTS9Y_00905 [Methylophilus sp.]
MDCTYIGFQKLVQEAAKAYDYFTEDELEAAADEYRANEAAKGDAK